VKPLAVRGVGEEDVRAGVTRWRYHHHDPGEGYMEKRRDEPSGSDFAEGEETLPRDEHVGSFGEGEETLPRDEHVGSFAEGEETLPEDDRIGTFADKEDEDAD
jgi:hypothetical protein